MKSEFLAEPSIENKSVSVVDKIGYVSKMISKETFIALHVYDGNHIGL